MKVAQNSSRMIGRCDTDMCARNSTLLAEFRPAATGMHQAIDLQETEEERLEELKALISLINFSALATGNGLRGPAEGIDQQSARPCCQRGKPARSVWRGS
jgi:hypothetical protein